MARCLDVALALLVLMSGCSDPAGPGVNIEACVSLSTDIDTCALYYNASITVTGGAGFDTTFGEFVTDSGTTSIYSSVVETPSGPLTVIATDSFALTADAFLRVTGPNPVGLVARTTIAIDGVIDLSDGGAGSRACDAERGKDDSGGGSGGGGGGFGAAGGAGGPGDQDTTPSTGGLGGVARARPPGVIGGCSGAHGGNASSGTGGAGGRGGGGLMIIAPEITFSRSGSINAGGGGGEAGEPGSGGAGGGGSGGFVLLAATLLELEGTVAANGGGGGEGGSGLPGKDGENGKLSIEAARGGDGGGSSPGGNGGATENRAGASVTATTNLGGGGGGGGVGFVAIHAQSIVSTNGIVSPAYSVWP